MPTLTEKPRWLTVKQAAQRLGLHEVTVRRKIRAGHLPALQLGGPGAAVRILEDELEGWLYRSSPADGSPARDSFAGADPVERRETQAMRGQSNPPAHAGEEQ
jgi:excisionase family DNA binding protein